jgi:hypothetical protein
MTAPADQAAPHFPVGRIVDIALGAVVMGTVGALIGVIMGSGAPAVACGLGILLGAVVGLFGGRRFLVSILIGTVLGGLLAWAVAGPEWITVGAGTGASMGGFLGVWSSMVLDLLAARKAESQQSE